MPNLKAGAGACAIKFPNTMFPTDGFIGIHDEPHVRILLLESEEKAALVLMELVNAPEDLIESVRDMVSKSTGTPVENIWVHVTHAITTPHAPRDPSISLPPLGSKPPAHKDGKAGPPPMDPEGPRKRKEFIAACVEASKNALDSAIATFTEVKVGVGTGYCDVNSNRDIETSCGWWVGINREGPSNKTATVVLFTDMADNPIGIFISYGLKPCAIDVSEQEEGTRLISSDVPGYACSKLEKKYGVPVMFAMSAAGDQVPREQAVYDIVNDDGTLTRKDDGISKGFDIVERLGEEMTADMEKIIEGIKCESSETPIVCASTGITWKSQERCDRHPTREITYEAGKDQELDSNAIVLGNLAFVAVKPEVNAVTEQQLIEKSPFGHTLLMAMVNGDMKYMPDKDSYNRITWEALSASVMSGCAEAWVNQTVKMLNEIKDDMKDSLVTEAVEQRPDGE